MRASQKARLVERLALSDIPRGWYTPRLLDPLVVDWDINYPTAHHRLDNAMRFRAGCGRWGCGSFATRATAYHLVAGRVPSLEWRCDEHKGQS